MSAKATRPRRGSLAWYRNSPRGILVPSMKTRDQVYLQKIQMTTVKIGDRLVSATILRKLPFSIVNKDQIQITLDESGKKILRNAQGHQITAEWVGTPVNVTGYNKPRGILGPVQRRNVKMQKRKADGAGTTRHAGCMGCRQPGTTSWRKPFAGRHGGNRRTIRGNLLLECFPHHVVIKGSLPGKKGTIVAVRKTIL